jgi:hypothetical protein
MSAQQTKKHRKQKKREQKNIERRKREEQIRKQRVREGRYPMIRIDETHGHPEFVKVVRDALAKIDFDDPNTFGPAERAFLQVLREDGVRGAASVLNEAVARLEDSGNPDAPLLVPTLLPHFGDVLFNKIPEETRQKLLPYNDVRVDYVGHDIVLRLSSMRRKSGGWGGTIHYSNREPTIRLQDQEWKVGFSRHAIERICARLNPRYLTYAAAGDVHAVLNKCIWYEPVTLFPDQPAFAIWDTCNNPTFLSYRLFVQEVLGEQNVVPGDGPCYHRVGYCPVAFEDGFAKAKSFLCPGYEGTPEYGLVRRSRLPELEKDLLLHSASSSDLSHLAEEGVEAIKWFHDNGVPQVMQMKHKVFDE